MSRISVAEYLPGLVAGTRLARGCARAAGRTATANVSDWLLSAHSKHEAFDNLLSRRAPYTSPNTQSTRRVLASCQETDSSAA